MSYESPIKLLQDKIQFSMDGEIIKAVQNVGVDVSKDELIKALQYDRGQYQKGYEDGKEDATTQWIPVSERLPDDDMDIVGCWSNGGVAFYWSSSPIWKSALKRKEPSYIVAWMPLPEPYKVGENDAGQV